MAWLGLRLGERKSYCTVPPQQDITVIEYCEYEEQQVTYGEEYNISISISIPHQHCIVSVSIDNQLDDVGVPAKAQDTFSTTEQGELHRSGSVHAFTHHTPYKLVQTRNLGNL